jgi:hypothetical protein
MALSMRIFVALLAISAATPVHAHRLSPGFFGLTETADGQFDARWKVSVSGGLADVLIPELPEACVVAGQPAVFLLDGVQAPREFRLQQATVLCDRPLAGQRFAIRGLDATDTDVLLSIEYLDGSTFTHRLLPHSAAVVIPERSGVLDVVETYTLLGVEHILLGIDHLLFVFALLLLVTGMRQLILTITAFTAAHSITLAAATLGWINVSPAAVEATIALSILFLATELARRSIGNIGESGEGLTSRWPWVVAFSFGLLHGFGFAGALREIGLPEQSIALSLLFFNVGVELGQLLFVGVVIACGYCCKRLGVSVAAGAPRYAAYVIGSVSAYWVFERTWYAIEPLGG